MIEVTGLTRYYGEFAAVKDVTFQIAMGEVVGLLGLNGAGKSTTMKVLAGLLAPSRGRVLIEGIDVVQAPEALRGRIGYLPEDPPLYDDMTVRAFLAHCGRLKGMTADAIRRRVPEVIELAHLAGREDQVIGTLSHGYRKRVGIAMSVVHDPKLVILDEPISGLDPQQIADMRRVVRDLGHGRAVLISSHILSEISQTCDRILVYHHGRLVAQGTEQELGQRSGSDSRLVLTVRGSPEAFETWARNHPRVRSVARRDSDPGFAVALVDLDGDAREAVIADAVQAGFGIRLVESPADELEEIFLGLTRGAA
ncbi:MAG: ABC transporter ATP-binding protein [Deltaproteobacteria bacterium]|nr:ABC transporter ATP-binding protein [Deltaproteobacteria bacterium]